MSTQDHPDTKVTAPGIKERKYEKLLKCPLTDKELIETGDALAQALHHLSSVNGELDAIKADYKGKVKAAEADIEQHRNRMQNKFEMRPVECIEVKNFADRKLIAMRLDTNEIIEERSLRQDELQQPLPGMADEVPPATSDADGETESTEAAEETDGASEEE